MKLPIRFLDKTTILIIISSLLFSFWLMFHTFSYNQGSMLIASKVWSDFSAHIPLIRSFSLGANFPPEYPLFSGEPIKYHFLFYLVVGILERLGLRIDLALNIPSALSFAFLMVTIYYFAKTLFKSKAVGVLALLFFLFNGSLSFLEFFRVHPLSLHSFQDIISNNTFPSFGPWDGKDIAAFWNLNIYTNQRHLSLAYALSLAILTYFISSAFNNKKIRLKFSIIIGIILGLFFFFHFAVLLITVIVLIGLFILFPVLRTSIFTTMVTTSLLLIPQYFYFQTGNSTSKITFTPGYLITAQLNFIKFIQYWFANFGLHSILAVLGFILASKNLKKVFLVFLPIFIIGNLFQFSVEMAANHKFFNFFLIVLSMFSAYFLVYIWQYIKLSKPLVLIAVFLLIFSGIIDFFPIMNDSKIALADYPINKDASWIINNTSPHDIFLNSSYLYDPASLAGRKIFMGWPYFPWSAGYDTDTRGKMMTKILGSTDKITACQLLLDNKVDYLEIEIRLNNDPDFPKLSDLFQNEFSPIYTNPSRKYSIYSIRENCPYVTN